MKVDEAPEKIYIRPLPNPSDGYVGIAWDEPHKTMVEYIRKDAFIEKAINFIEMLGYGFTITDNITHTCYGKEQMIEDFEEHLKK